MVQIRIGSGFALWVHGQESREKLLLQISVSGTCDTRHCCTPYAAHGDLHEEFGFEKAAQKRVTAS